MIEPLVYLVFFLLFLVADSLAFLPLAIDNVAAARAGRYVWFYGNNNTNSVLYSLDVTQSWPTSSPLWAYHPTNLSNDQVSTHRYLPTMEVGDGGNMLWIFGDDGNSHTETMPF